MGDAQRVRFSVDASGLARVDGAPLFAGSMGHLLDALDRLRRTGRARLVITPNVDQILSLETDAHWRELFALADVRIADGAPVVALARSLGARDVRRLTGSDLMAVAIAEAPARGWRVAVVGGCEADAEHMAAGGEHVRVFPVPTIRGDFEPSRETVAALAAFAPDVTFICLGSPKQEKWFAHWRGELPAGVYVGAGAGIDFLAGRAVRAPRIVQRLGFEWTWRLAQEPRRLAHRYLVRGPRFLRIIARSLLPDRPSRRAGLIAGPREQAEADRANTVFVSWFAHHGRSESLAEALGIPGYFVFDRSDAALPLRYARQWSATRRLLAIARPAQLLVMQPPVLALLAVRMSRWGRRARIAADFHTGSFLDPKWRWSLGLSLRLMGRGGLAVVTNDALAERVRARGYRAVAVHDWISEITPGRAADGEYMLLPFAWASDEPMQELIDAARTEPAIEWRVTGRAPDWVAAAAPPNLKLLGFLSPEEYWDQFDRAGAIGALTTKDFTMQRAGYEALCRARPLLTTPTTVLREYFGEAAIYAEPTADGLVAGARDVLRRRGELSAKLEGVRREKIAAQGAALDALRAWLSEGER